MKTFTPLALAVTLLSAALAAEPPPKPAAFTDPAKTDADFPFQGEFVGQRHDEPFALQVIALGQGKFEAALCPGGLPGAGWTKRPNPRQRMPGKRENDTVRFTGNGWNGLLRGKTIELQDFKGLAIGKLERLERQSPSLGAKPPEGAVVLFDGSSLAAFKDGAQMTPDHLLKEGCTSKEEFGDCTIHVEFRLPYMPDARGQGRGNSGLYLAGRYEVQMLDSFGLNGENNECGGLYTIAKPQVNLCLPPLTWQTYDIDYQAPRFDDQGQKLADAEATIRHNGVLIHDQVKLPHPTTSAPLNREGPLGPIYLQNHGNPVRYRNIWVVKR